MLWFCKRCGWAMGDQHFPAYLLTKCSHVVKFWQMTCGQKRSEPFLGPSIHSVSPSLWLEWDGDLSGLPHPPGLGSSFPRAGHSLAPQERLSTSAFIHEREESLYLDGTTIVRGLFVQYFQSTLKTQLLG